MRPTLRTALLAAWAMIVLAIIAGILLMVNPMASHAETVIVNNYQVQESPSGWVCWGLVGCLIAGAMEAQERQAQGPHLCNVWDGRRYVQATCAP